jgi:hypothetical protein
MIASRLFIATIIGSAVCVHASAAHADESGVGFWLSGSYASFSALPPEPGWSIPALFYYYDGSAGAGKSFQHGSSVTAGLRSQSAVVFLTPTWAPAGENWFGGQPSFSLTLGAGWNATSASLATSTVNGNESRDVSSSMWGGADLSPAAQIAWARGNHNWMTYLTGNIPTGAYQSSRLANIGLGHSAVDIGGAYTYSNEAGTESSAVLGFTYNGVNPHTSVRSGFDSHFDFSVSRSLSPHLQLGIAGYLYYQLTPDSGSGNKLGAFKSQVAALGPQVGFAFQLLGRQVDANLRGYWEFWNQNHLQGRAAYLTLSTSSASDNATSP